LGQLWQQALLGRATVDAAARDAAQQAQGRRQPQLRHERLPQLQRRLRLLLLPQQPRPRRQMDVPPSLCLTSKLTCE